MRKLLTTWCRKYFSDPEVAILILCLTLGIAVFMTMGDILAPVFASIVVSYLLYSLVTPLLHIKIPYRMAVIAVFLLFITLVSVSLLGILPLLWHQLGTLFNQLPSMFEKGQQLLMDLPERYPDFISAEQLQELLNYLHAGVGRLGQTVLSLSLASIPGIISLCIYLILVPLLVYFFLMDRTLLLNWVASHLPHHRGVLSQVWTELLEQIGNYVRGKIVEMIIVAVVCYIAFLLMHLSYPMLLGTLVGVSVIIPYVGAFLVTIPVLVIAFLQWGWSAHFAYFTLVYALIIAVDANILVPVLFAEVVKLHPVAIILAVLIFGSFWGFWGVFFAIPLASLVKAILNAWPVLHEHEP